MINSLIGNAITLRQIDGNDTANIVKWRNSPKVIKNLYSQNQITSIEHTNWLENYVKTGKCHQFIISINNSKFDIGTVFIKNIDKENLKGEFGIFIGEEIEQGKGYGSEATKLICQYGFEKLSLNKLYLSVFSDNIYAIKAYSKQGFEQTGLFKQDIKRQSSFLDVVYMEFLKENFAKVPNLI